MLAQTVSLRICFALLWICDECRDCGGTGDMNGFVGGYYMGLLICTCMSDGGGGGGDAEMKMLVLSICVQNK